MKESRDIEFLVNWALEGQGLGGGVQADAGSLSWTLLGTRVDGGTGDYFYSGRGVVDGAPDYDATVILAAITGLPQDVAALLVRFGRLGYGEFARPDWCPEGEGAWEVVKTSTGKIKWEYADAPNHNGERRPKTQFVGNRPETVIWYREQYGIWWRALRQLVPIVNLALKSHEATGPKAPAEPWAAAYQPVIHLAS